jgi:hypothetical protein
MKRTRTRFLLRVALGLCAATVVLSCGDDTTRPKNGCYTVDEVFATGASVGDSTAARTAFLAYLAHLDETDGYPVFRWNRLEYLRSSGREDYAGKTYWGIVARGQHQDGGTVDNQQFRVRQDGAVVLMLGCI